MFTCDQKDLEHWLAGNAPVIVVVSHPKKQQAWWIDIKAAFADPKARAKRRLVIDKARHAFDRDAGAALLQLGMPISSGLYLQPPPRPEVLDTNLLRVVSLPEQLYVAPSVTSEYTAAGELLESTPGDRPAFVLRDRLVISFVDMRDSALRVLCSDVVETHDVSEWAESTNQDARYSLQDLMIRTILNAYAELRWHKG